jgi:hypothetical protein
MAGPLGLCAAGGVAMRTGSIRLVYALQIGDDIWVIHASSASSTTAN